MLSVEARPKLGLIVSCDVMVLFVCFHFFSLTMGLLPADYDGWSSMSKLLQPGDPALVIKRKANRKDAFKLSESSDVSGLALARAMHKWCHKSRICRCEELGHEYTL